MINIKNNLNLTTIGGFIMGGFSQTGPLKFKFFSFLSWTHEIFKVREYKEKIKFDKIWDTKMGKTERALQNSNFLPFKARPVKLLR